MATDLDTSFTDGDHAVRFYEAQDDLVRLVVGYLSGAVLDGDTVVVIMEPAHREALESALAETSIDVGAIRAEGRLQVLDATEILSRFMVDGMPDPAAFDATVGELIRTAGPGRVRAYGDMVAVLCQAGNVPGAIELERLWDRLVDTAPLALLCAYPVDLLGAPAAADEFAQICELHSHVVAGAPGIDGADAVRRYAPTLHAPRLARHFVTEVLQSWHRHDLVEDAAVVASELAANAVMHADSDLTVGVTRRGDLVRIEVCDASDVAPLPRDVDVTGVGGRGLRLVEALAHRWGHSPVPGGKRIWVDLGSASSLEGVV